MMGVNTLIYSLSYPLFALVLDARGVAADLIGYTSAAQSGAVFAVAPLVPWLIARLGPMTVAVTSLAAVASLFLALPLFESVLAWGLLRFCLGAVETTLWIAGESWVNQLAPEQGRGRAMAVYTMSLSAGFALGPLVLAVTGSDGWTPFVAAALLVGVAGLPLLLVRGLGDDMRGASAGRPWQVLRRAPVPMLANLVFAATSGALVTFMPVYGVSLGLDESTALMLVTVGAIGGIALQPLAGRLADRVDRHLLLAALVGAALLGSALMPLLLAVSGWNYVYQFFAYGVRACIYGLSLTLMGERFRGAELAGASAVFNLMWGLGSMAGPALGGHAMALSPGAGLPLSVGLLLAALLPLPLLAWWRQRRNALAHPPG